MDRCIVGLKEIFIHFRVNERMDGAMKYVCVYVRMYVRGEMNPRAFEYVIRRIKPDLATDPPSETPSSGSRARGSRAVAGTAKFEKQAYA